MAKTEFKIQLNEEQKKAKAQILRHPFSIIEGQAGSGKTLLACQVGLDKLRNKKDITKIVITRPTVSTEDNGFLPGTIEEKMEEWVVPIKSNFSKLMPTGRHLEKHYEGEHPDIELVALSHFRGRTFENAVCIVDEYQNLTKQQLAMALGRLGKNSIMIFTGDPKQIDLKFKNDSAAHLIHHLKVSDQVFHTELLENHRHSAVSEVLKLIKDYI